MNEALASALRAAGEAARRSMVTRLANDRASPPHALAMMRAGGRALRLAVDNAGPTTDGGINEALRAAIVRDIEPVLSVLRILIRQPDRATLLSLQSNLPTLEIELLRNEHSDATWLDFLLAEFVTGLESLDTTAANAAASINWESGTGNQEPITSALRNAQARDLLPTHLDTAGLRDLDAGLRARSFFSARTTNAGYLAELKKLVERHIRGEGLDSDLAQLRVEARQMLKAFGYTPEKGFKGDAKLGVPSAEPGSLRDLGSERRLNLIFKTQASLMRGLAQQMRGLDRIDQFPSWELIRIEKKKTPRDWLKRWSEAGGPFSDQAVSRMIAPKDGEVWSVIGDSAVFNDALDVDHPPFAFESGMGWREVGITELRSLGIALDTPGDPGMLVSEAAKQARENAQEPAGDVDDIFIGGQSTLDQLARRLKQIEATSPRLTIEDIKRMK